MSSETAEKVGCAIFEMALSFSPLSQSRLFANNSKKSRCQWPCGAVQGQHGQASDAASWFEELTPINSNLNVNHTQIFCCGNYCVSTLIKLIFRDPNILLGERKQLNLVLMHTLVPTICFLPFYFLKLFTTVLSQRDSSHGKFGLFSLGKASCDSHTTQPTVLLGV